VAELRRLVIAGGGTGGHLYPGIAVAREAEKDGVEVLFIGTMAGIESRILPREGLRLATINAGKYKGVGVAAKLRTLVLLPSGISQAAKVLREFGADAVLGVGGYASFYAGVAARLIGIPLVVQEQNAYPGLANRLLGRLAGKIALGFADAAGFFPAGRSEFTGNPVRGGLNRASRGTSYAMFGLSPGRMTVFVFGGSGGAHSINKAMVEALGYMEELTDVVQFIHQTGDADLDMVKKGYLQSGFAASVRPYINEMAEAYACADLVVCRSGAMTVAELTSLGKPALLIPYPFAANNHQELNARVLEREGAARLILDREASGGRLAAEVEKILADKGVLAGMTGRSLTLGKSDSAKKVYDICKALAVAR
jgi:UDP-N-acetylglucosamine--N-acetylmuramyl-(pentapeptide) pyrophosphoryl-undecaprenol N-acetylglucosamine transferase